MSPMRTCRIINEIQIFQQTTYRFTRKAKYFTIPMSVDNSQRTSGTYSSAYSPRIPTLWTNIAPIAQSLSALDFNFERAVEGSILTAGKNVESVNLNVIIRAIN